MNSDSRPTGSLRYKKKKVDPVNKDPLGSACPTYDIKLKGEAHHDYWTYWKKKSHWEYLDDILLRGDVHAIEDAIKSESLDPCLRFSNGHMLISYIAAGDVYKVRREEVVRLFLNSVEKPSRDSQGLTALDHVISRLGPDSEVACLISNKWGIDLKSL